MSTGFFFSNPVQPQAPINNNVINNTGGDDQKYYGLNGGYNNHTNSHSNQTNGTMQQQLIHQYQQNQQMVNQHQVNVQQNQYIQQQPQQQFIQQQNQFNQHQLLNQQQQQSGQHVNHQQQFNQQQNQFNQHNFLNQQKQQQSGQYVNQQQQFNQQQNQFNQQQLQQHINLQQQVQNQYQEPQNIQMGTNQSSVLSRNDINNLKAMISSQCTVPNPLAQANAPGGIMNNSNSTATQSSFFGTLFNQLNLFANNNAGGNQPINNNLTNINMSGGNSFANNNLMVANQTQHSTNSMSGIGTTNNHLNQMVQQSGTPTASMAAEEINYTGTSPVPMAFMTPRMSLTPNPPTNPPTPMMTPRMGMTPDPLAGTPAPLDSLDGSNEEHDKVQGSWSTTTNINIPKDSNQKVRAASSKKNTKAVTASAIANAQKSFFRRGITSVGSALTVVANYINESLLSGIPFHIADRAMRESKETYAKWWEDGINDGDTVDEENPDESLDQVTENEGRAEKKRKLDSGEAVCTQSKNCGSALSASLEKNYNAVGIDTRQITKQEDTHAQEQVLISSSMPHTKPIEVDSSIIKRRRSQFDHACKEDSTAQGYDIFNSIGYMYDADFSEGGNKGSKKVASNSFSCNETPDIFAESTTTATTITSNSTIDGTLKAIGQLIEEKNNVEDEQEIYHMISSPRQWVTRTLRSELVDALQSSQGDTKDKRFLSSLEILNRFYKSTGRDARVNPWSVRKVTDECSNSYGYSGSETGGPLASDLLEGSWVNMSRPNYVECLGKNKENDFMYTLGRMSFDMFQPGDLICSVQSTHNNIRIVGEQEELPAFVPKSLKEEVATLSNSNGDSTSKRPLLRSYDIAVSMTLEPPASVGQPEPSGTISPTKRLRAIIAVKGYVLPDPHVPNRLTVWFAGGKLCPAKLADEDDDEDFDDQGESKTKTKRKSKKPTVKSASEDDEYGGFEEWSALFSKGKWRKTLGERARAMAAKLLLGADIPNKMEDDGHMEYSLHRPVGGHSKVYVDVMYLDDDILIMRGHRGTIYAMSRSGVSQRYRNMQD